MHLHDADQLVGPFDHAPTRRLAALPSARHRVGAALAVLALLAAVLLVADILLMIAAPLVYRIDAGTYRGGFFLTNVSGIETDGAGQAYRWTLGESTFRLAPTSANSAVLVTFELGGRPQAGRLTLSDGLRDLGTFTATAAPQRIAVLLPQRSQPLALKLHSDTFTPPNDSRALGLKLHGVTLTVAPETLPLPPLVPYASQLVLLLVGWVMAGRLGGGGRLRMVLAIVLAVALAVALRVTLPVADVYFVRLAVAGLVLLAATMLVLPYLVALLAGDRREARLLWALMLAACGIRAIGALFPTFAGQDLHYHINWFKEVLSGDMFLAVHSSEFAGGAIVYPPGTYAALAPGVLLTPDLQVLLQGVLALLDGTGALFVALLAYRLGLGRQTARFGAVLYAGSLPTFTALAYGFSAQVFAQWFIAPLALALLYAADARTVRSWALAMLLLLFPLLIHVGVAILAVTWVSAVLLLLFVRRDHRQWWALVFWAAAGVLSVLLVYSYGLEGMLLHGREVVQGSASAPNATSAGVLKGLTPLMFKGARLAYSEIGLVLLPIGVWLVARARLTWSQRVVAGALLLTVLFYFVVDLFLGLQVRYFYFAIPLVLTLIAHALAALERWRRWGGYVAWALALFMCAQGTAQWWLATFGDLHLSLTPLTH